MSFDTPENLVELLNKIIHLASQTIFWSPKIASIESVDSLESFSQIPSTKLTDYRKQLLPDLIVRPNQIDWIVGAYKGHDPTSPPVAESVNEATLRYDVFVDAVKACIDITIPRTCVVQTTPERRYFASEVATMLISAGVAAHVFTDTVDTRTYERIHLLKPSILVALGKGIDEQRLGDSIELSITLGANQQFHRSKQLDLLHVDEIGFLAQSAGDDLYTPNNDIYLFEQSSDGNIVVTSLYNHVQPILRVEVPDMRASKFRLTV